MNPLYQQLQAQPQQVQMSNMNPVQRINYIRQAMANPGLYIKQCFPDIPDQISGDPNAILEYLKQTRGISNMQIQNLINMYGGFK